MLVPDSESGKSGPERIVYAPVPVLHQGKSCAVIDKPAFLAVEADGPDDVIKRLSKQLGPPGGRAWPRVVHRLDTGTSGCLCVALNQRGEKALALGFLEGEIEKNYLALVRGQVPDQGRFDTAFGPDPKDGRKHTTRIETPRRARLSWKLVERFDEAALVRVVLDTGRTHQIRVQFSEAGFPVVGDVTYDPIETSSASPKLQEIARDLARPGLHAVSLSLVDPDGDGIRRVHCEAPMPADLMRALDRLR